MPAFNSMVRPGGFGAQAARNTNDVVIGRGAGMQPGTFAPQGITPDNRLAILQADPAYAAAALNANDSATNAGIDRQAAIRQAAIQFGGLPKDFNDQYGDVDQATLQLANDNPYSQLAQDSRAFGQQQVANRQAEAANGSIFSSQLNTDLGNENYAHGLNLANLAGAFGGAVNKAIGNFTGTIDTNKANLANALGTAETNQSQNPAYFGPSNDQIAPTPINGQNVHPTTFAPPAALPRITSNVGRKVYFKGA